YRRGTTNDKRRTGRRKSKVKSQKSKVKSQKPKVESRKRGHKDGVAFSDWQLANQRVIYNSFSNKSSRCSKPALNPSLKPIWMFPSRCSNFSKGIEKKKSLR